MKKSLVFSLILLSALIIFGTTSVWALSMEQKYLQRLQNVQSEAEFNQILEDLTDEPDYQQMCRELNSKVTKENEDLQNFNTEGMSVEQLQSNKKFVKEWEEFTEVYGLFNDVYCMYTISKWMPQEPKISIYTKAECDEVFKRKTALAEEYNEAFPNIETEYESYFVAILNQHDKLDKKWKAECESIEYFKGDAICGTGTIENEKGQCVPVIQSKGGGCLIATATFGSELALQVQMLRVIRDNSLLQTESGRSFMESFHSFYYSFSPGVADLEREHPLFKEGVKLAITPLITSLSILNYVDMDSESEVLGYGISLIILNVGMYFVLPTIVIHRVRKFV